VVICLELGADLHTAQLMLPLTVSCFSKIQIGFTFLVPARLGSPGKGPLNGCVCVCALTVLGGHQEEHQACKNMSVEVLVWLSVWSEVQIVCIWSS